MSFKAGSLQLGRLAELYFQFLAPGLKRYQQAKIAFRNVLKLEFTEGIADRTGDFTISCYKNYGEVGQQFVWRFLVSNLPNQHHAGGSFFVLESKIDGVVAGMEKHLAIDLMGSAYADRLRIIRAVINQGRPQTLQGLTARRSGQPDHCLHLLFR